MEYYLVILLGSLLTIVNGLTNNGTSVCCDKGKEWFTTTSERCGRYSPTPIPGIATADQAWCSSVIEVCCLREKQEKQCQTGVQHAKTRGTCQDFYRGVEATRQCCHCCKLGLEAKKNGQSCQNLPDLSTDLVGCEQGHCHKVMVTCCLGNEGTTVATQRPTLAPTPYPTPAPIASQPPGICARFFNQLCAHKCEDTPGGSYRCSCYDGFALQSDGRTCVQINAQDRCATNNPCQHHCEDTGITIICKCFDGFALQSDGRSCDDIDECSLGTHTCTSVQRCRNTLGTFACEGLSFQGTQPPGHSCLTGFAYNPYTQSCEDIDECTIGLSPCSGGKRCLNSPGSYRCLDQGIGDEAPRDCGVGFNYNFNSRRCEDVNECALSRDSCIAGQQCENTIGSYVCRRAVNCGTGYTLDKESQRCVDDDECLLGTHSCGVGRECRNIPGSFHCVQKTCPSGYRLDFSSGRCEQVICTRGMRADAAGNCVDINECREQPTVCRANQECRNTIGSYTCRNLVSCGPGFELDPSGNNCVDVNECTKGTHDCTGRLQTCINRRGTYECQCPEGYQMNHRLRICEDINECERYGSSVCTQNSECQNTEGSFRCTCMEGFQNDPADKSCKDIDECTSANLCQHTCHNTWGSYRCACTEGYQLREDLRSCEDIDECTVWEERGGSLCIGVCRNTLGSFECSCPSGYSMMADSRTCRDIDECTTGSANCNGPDDYCINTRGGHKCETITCPNGFVKAPSLGSRGNLRNSDPWANYKRRYRYHGIGSIVPRPPPVFQTAETGVLCLKMECRMGDIDCILNRTLSVQYQDIAIPSIDNLEYGPLNLIDIEPEAASPYPNLSFTIENGNVGGSFEVKVDKTQYNRGSLSIVKPILGPRKITLTLRIDNRNSYGSLISSHYAIILINVSSHSF